MKCRDTFSLRSTMAQRGPAAAVAVHGVSVLWQLDFSVKLQFSCLGFHMLHTSGQRQSSLCRCPPPIWAKM